VPDLLPYLAGILPHSATPYIALVLAGFAIGIFGHLSSSRRLVALGVALIFVGALLLPVALRLSESPPPRLENTR
jgi:hypothetical protein